MVLVSSAFVTDTEPFYVLMADSIILPIPSFFSCSVLLLRDAASLTICSALNCVSLEANIFSCGTMNFSDTILSTTSNVRAVKFTVHKLIGHKEALSGRHLDKARYMSKNMSGVIVTVYPWINFQYLFKFVIDWHTSCVLRESSTLSIPT